MPECFVSLTPKMGRGINKTPERNILAQVCIVSNGVVKVYKASHVRKPA